MALPPTKEAAKTPRRQEVTRQQKRPASEEAFRRMLIWADDHDIDRRLPRVFHKTADQFVHLAQPFHLRTWSCSSCPSEFDDGPQPEDRCILEHLARSDRKRIGRAATRMGDVLKIRL
jgi:hypothetical protein